MWFLVVVLLYWMFVWLQDMVLYWRFVWLQDMVLYWVFVWLQDMVQCYTRCLYGCKNMVPYWVFVWLQDMVLYSVFAFLYLVGTSLVASAFDFYQKMKTNVSSQTVHQLVIVVVRIACALQDRGKQ